MPVTRPAVHVRSHRRAGRRRRLLLAPWIVITISAVIAASGVVVGYTWLATRGCSGKPTVATVVASPDIAKIVDNLGREWESTEPAVDGRCAAIEVVSKDSAQVARTLRPQWDARADGPPPTVWVPESTAWLKMASADEDAERMIPDLQPSLARTPTVIAMPMPMAKVLNWPNTQLSWRKLIQQFSSAGWERHGKPQWGRFRVGMTDPIKSTAGLHALMAVADADDDGAITVDERQGLVALKKIVTEYGEHTEEILSRLAKLDSEGEDKVLRSISAFPALERDILLHNNLSKPKVPLVAVYPDDGSSDADHPYLVLDAPWSGTAQRRVANAFLGFARGDVGRAAFLDAGFRDANRAPGRGLERANGFEPQIQTVPRAVLVPESVTLTVSAWQAGTKPCNVLLVFDVSDSMGKAVPGTRSSRLTILKQAATQTIGLFGDQARVGLWKFAAKLDGDKDHEVLVNPGLLSDKIGSTDRRGRLLTEIDRLQAAGGGSGVYDTVAAAYRELKTRFLPNATNLVLIVTDGKNEDDGISLEALRQQLSGENDKTRQVRVATVAYGGEADVDALRAIALAGSGHTGVARNETALSRVLISTLFA